MLATFSDVSMWSQRPEADITHNGVRKLELTFACNDIESAERKQHADNRGAQIACGKGDGADASTHMRHAAFVGIEGNGFYAATSTATVDRVAEFVKRDDKHLRMMLALGGLEGVGVEDRLTLKGHSM